MNSIRAVGGIPAVDEIPEQQEVAGYLLEQFRGICKGRLELVRLLICWTKRIAATISHGPIPAVSLSGTPP